MAYTTTFSFLYFILNEIFYTDFVSLAYQFPGVTMLKHHDQKQPWEKRAYFSLQSQKYKICHGVEGTTQRLEQEDT